MVWGDSEALVLKQLTFNNTLSERGWESQASLGLPGSKTFKTPCS